MRNTTTVVIAAGAVLAAVIVTRTPAQQESGVGACCYGAAGCYVTGTGVVDCLQGGGTWIDGGTCVECPPPPGPTVVAGAVAFPPIATGGNSLKSSEVAVALRFWSDGQVDATRVYSQRIEGSCGGTPASVCDGPTVLLTGTCPTDVDRDGDTGINDFLTLLSGWGACR